MSAIDRSILKGNVNWDLKIMSAIEVSAIKCLLQRGFVMRVLLSFHPLLRKMSVVERCPL